MLDIELISSLTSLSFKWSTVVCHDSIWDTEPMDDMKQNELGHLFTDSTDEWRGTHLVRYSVAVINFV